MYKLEHLLCSDQNENLEDILHLNYSNYAYKVIVYNSYIKSLNTVRSAISLLLAWELTAKNNDYSP